MQVLYISYDGMTDNLGQSQVIPYLIGLSKSGYEITLVSCEKKELYKSKQPIIESVLNNNNINWQPVLYSTLPSVLSKLKNLRLIKHQIKKLPNTQTIEIVHCRSYMAALIGLFVKKNYGAKFIFDMRGFWADERIDGGIWNKNNKLHRKMYSFFKKKELEFIQQADYTISLTESAKKEINSWERFKGKLLPIEVIPCCVDLELFNPKLIEKEDTTILKSRLGVDDSNFVICYLGSIGTWYMLDEMLDFFIILKAKKKNAKFLFITPDHKQGIINKAKEKRISLHDIIIQSATRNDVPKLLSLADLAIYFIKPVYSKKASSPTKMGELMAMGIPIITNTGIGDSDSILNDTKSGVLVNKFDMPGYQKAVKELDVLLKLDKMAIRKAAEKYYSLTNGIQLYLSTYKKLRKKKIT